MFIAISNSDPAPLYEQIKTQIVEQIVVGKLPPGYLLPSIRVLARELGISVITVKKAYEDLEVSGYIITRPGKGSCVSEGGAEYIRENRLKEMEASFETGIREGRRLGMADLEIAEVFKTVLDLSRDE